ncbi:MULTISPECIES: triple tyrosine motif-containing protein [Flavobacteriaceae]|uniref:helix-turn-helix and ligand-binding sensor domain-containing protein n=1 Tax=Flavobacteriaceae TaxID=49546 RepID=UPI001492AD08|nr:MULTISPECIES: triple tyrosine motif-containing protein [Allomuricauda]MDC6367527.1 triple tyrosine motif-containing protein [Muricauda sp. AC10]
MPPIQNFSPTDYRAESQNWAISQTDDKTIYIANNRGLLAYNGSQWTFSSSPNESIIRAVKAVDDRIYTGCYMEFGYWQKDDFGRLNYTSLSKRMQKSLVKDEEFWSILNMGEWMVFQSHSRIYIYNLSNDSVNVIESDSFLPKVFQVGQSVLFQKMGKGIFQIKNGESFLVYKDEEIQHSEVINIFEHQEEYLILTRDNGFFKTQEGFLEKWPTNADDFLNNISLYSGLKLKNGDYVLGTISNGLLLMDNSGHLLDTIDQTKGLQNNTILSIHEDRDQNIWLGLDVGISYINMESPFQVYPDNEGLIGSVYDSAISNGNLYIGTNQGLFYKKQQDQSEFKFIEGTQGQVWSLNTIDGILYCGHHTGTYIIKGDRAEKISEIQGTWKIGRLNDNDLLLQGNYDGLYVLEKSAGNWTLRNKIDGFDHSARYFEVFGDSIFVNHEYKGVFKLQVSDDFLKMEKMEVDTLIKGSNSGIVKYKGDLLYAYKKGIFKYSWEEKTFVKDTLLSNLYTEDEYVSGKIIKDAQNGNLWAFSKANVSFVSEGGLAKAPVIHQIPLTEDMRNGIIGYESVTALPENGKYLIGARSGYFTLDTDRFEIDAFQVDINKIRKAGKERIQTDESLINSKTEGDFASYENSLEITYHVASYQKYLRPKFQYQLEGIYSNWSNWSEDSNVSFENLPSGDYIFRVRAKIGDRVSSNVSSYQFKIARPWYSSNLFIVLYVLGGILGSIAIHASYRRYYHKRQQQLIARNKREMELAKAQNEKEIIKIKNEQLKKEFQSKSNELAASTMSIIKKNELLSKIKEQLISSVADKNSVKPIIQIIDTNLGQKDDWEFFKEAFNNADRKFLKKLKKAHPNLSPNDIKLCAYLRLNLSSKEIAPMFNISPRSVEIKRYRLRKKMDLSHDDNLVDYILKL